MRCEISSCVGSLRRELEPKAREPSSRLEEFLDGMSGDLSGGEPLRDDEDGRVR